MSRELSRQIETALTQAVREAERKVGGELPNGAIILQTAFARDLINGDGDKWAEEHIVLAMAPGHFQPFVVWSRTIGTQQLATGGFGALEFTFDGWYHRDLDQAVSAFQSRLADRSAAGSELTL